MLFAFSDSYLRGKQFKNRNKIIEVYFIYIVK